MEKTLNLVVYLPGHAGHFIHHLLLLDEKTFIPYDCKSIAERVQKLTFKNLYWKYGSWKNFHDEATLDANEFITRYTSQYEKYISTICLHPSHKENIFTSHKKFLDMIKIKNFVLVKLSPKLEYIIDDFKSNNNFPLLHKTDLECYETIKNTYNPYIVNLDNFFYGVESFIAEYQSLAQHLNLDSHLDVAIELYKDWYHLRRLSKYNLKIGAPTWT